MAAPEGNQFWRLAKNMGRPRAFETPELLWEECQKYFEWVDSNPLQEEKAFPYQGKITKTTVSKMRAMTMGGLFIFLGLSHQTWSRMREREEFQEVTALVDTIIREQKFTGAAADLLNPTIIARDLGLKDSFEHTGQGGGPIKTESTTIDPKALSTEALKEILAAREVAG